MGTGSKQRQKYYIALGGIYLIVGILPLALVGQTADCPTICALRFPDRPWKNWECTTSIGMAVENYLDEKEYKRIYAQFYPNATGPCFICEAANKTTLLEPCKPCPAALMTDGGIPWEATDERYSTLSSCATPGAITECATATPPNYKIANVALQNPKYCLEDNTCTLDSADPLAFLTNFDPEPDIGKRQLNLFGGSLVVGLTPVVFGVCACVLFLMCVPCVGARGLMPVLLIAIAGMYLIQAIGCLMTACCLQSFKDRYGDQWLKISTCDQVCRGPCARLFPKINRILNLLSLFLIIFMIVVLWVWNTCADALNAFSQNVLHGTLTLWLVIVVAQYVLLCIGGTMFRTKFPEDLPFREPFGVIERGRNAPVCCCFCLCCYCTTVTKRQQWSVSLRLCCQTVKKGMSLFGP